MENRKQNLQSGFTLVELMVVVAIIGILAAVALPNFQKYQAKAKTSEAKLAISSLYMAEVSFQADNNTYATCLSRMGYSPNTNRYYTTGFNPGIAVGTAAVCGATISGVNISNFQADISSNGTPYGTGLASSSMAVTGTTGTAFVAQACGVVDSKATAATTGSCAGAGVNSWTINDSKVITQTNLGY